MAISPQAQRILDAYATTVGGRRDPRYTNVIDAIQNSPSLEAAFNKAAREGTLIALRLDQAGMARNGMGGAYYPDPGGGTIALRDTRDPYALVFTLAHEVQHANHSRQKATEYEQIIQSMEGGRLPLEESIAAYRRGSELLKHCQQQLGDAERKIQILENGALRDFDTRLGDAS